MKLSLITPVFNEADNLKELFTKIVLTLAPLDYQWEMIFVNDGSTDRSQASSPVACQRVKASSSKSNRTMSAESAARTTPAARQQDTNAIVAGFMDGIVRERRCRWE